MTNNTSHHTSDTPPAPSRADTQPAPSALLRCSIYTLLIVLVVGTVVGRIWKVESKSVGPNKSKTPFLSANDRSRWCTVRALVNDGTYVIDKMTHGKDPNWKTIDQVKHRGPDGREHFYSSKPPLLPTLLAGEYWVIRQLTGADIVQFPFYVGRIMLLVTNVLPLLLYFVVLARLIEQRGKTDWGRIYVMAAATFGTFLTTTAVTINNHLPAAICVLLAMAISLPIWHKNQRSLFRFFAAGLLAGFAAANELPALSFVALLGVGLFWKSPKGAMLGYLPAVVAVAAAFFGTNYIAHQSWKPPYAHRNDGPVIFSMSTAQAAPLDQQQIPGPLGDGLTGPAHPLSPDATVKVRIPGQRWVILDPRNGMRYAVQLAGDQVEVRHWDHWYDYEKSYWHADRRRGVDRGEVSQSVYLLHMLVGHHGVFSLTPIWLLSLLGMGILMLQRKHRAPGLVVLVGTLTVVCVVFYVLRPLQDRNYGGVCCGFRWLFWLIPLWLLLLVPAADAISGKRIWRTVALVLLLVSVASAAYASLNPWSHPWIYDYLQTVLVTPP